MFNLFNSYWNGFSMHEHRSCSKKCGLTAKQWKKKKLEKKNRKKARRK